MISTWDFIQSYLTTGCRVDICIHQQLRGTNLHQVTLQENIDFFFSVTHTLCTLLTRQLAISRVKNHNFRAHLDTGNSNPHHAQVLAMLDARSPKPESRRKLEEPPVSSLGKPQKAAALLANKTSESQRKRNGRACSWVRTGLWWDERELRRRRWSRQGRRQGSGGSGPGSSGGAGEGRRWK
jgi:uncharacterized membrane protein YgcG